MDQTPIQISILGEIELLRKKGHGSILITVRSDGKLKLDHTESYLEEDLIEKHVKEVLTQAAKFDRLTVQMKEPS